MPATKTLGTMIALLTAIAAPDDGPDPRTVDYARRATVVVMAEGENVTPSTGSGYVLSYGGRRLIVTNAHVLPDDRPRRSVMGRDGEKIRARLVGIDGTADIALLVPDRWPSGTDRPLVLADETPSTGEIVAVVGHPLRVGWVVDLGEVLGHSDVESCTILDVDVLPGSSGGPVVDADGGVVGTMMMLVRIGGARYGCAVTLESTRRVVDRLLDDGRGGMDG